jgi:hypothetical protein
MQLPMLVWASVYFWPFVVYLAFAIPAFVALRTRALDDATRAIWALIITVPLAGAVAFAIVQPGRRSV